MLSMLLSILGAIFKVAQHKTDEFNQIPHYVRHVSRIWSGADGRLNISNSSLNI